MTMKKLLLVCLFSLLFAGLAYAGPFDREEFDDVGYVDSKVITADGAVTSSPTYVYGISFYAGAASDFITLYNDTGTTTGQEKIEVSAATAGETKHISFDKPIKFETAVYADINGTSFAIIEYRQ